MRVINYKINQVSSMQVKTLIWPASTRNICSRHFEHGGHLGWERGCDPTAFKCCRVK